VCRAGPFFLPATAAWVMEGRQEISQFIMAGYAGVISMCRPLCRVQIPAFIQTVSNRLEASGTGVYRTHVRPPRFNRDVYNRCNVGEQTIIQRRLHSTVQYYLSLLSLCPHGTAACLGFPHMGGNRTMEHCAVSRSCAHAVRHQPGTRQLRSIGLAYLAAVSYRPLLDVSVWYVHVRHVNG
jgi:hypothetical protein